MFFRNVFLKRRPHKSNHHNPIETILSIPENTDKKNFSNEKNNQKNQEEPENTHLPQLNINHVKSLSQSKIGFVITTCKHNNLFVIQNINRIKKFLPECKIFLYLNEVLQKQDILDVCLTLQIETFIIDNQEENGGLTATWNSGITECIKNDCKIIVLSNDDLFINDTIYNILKYALIAYEKEELFYFGPISNNPSISEKEQLFLSDKDLKNPLQYCKSKGGLNGFFMVFPINSLLLNKYDETHYFDPAYPFGGNENEWYGRFRKIGGKGIIVPSTFVYHYKLKLWRTSNESNDTCFYTVNTQQYDKEIICVDASPHDFFYFTDNENDIYKCISKNILPILVEPSANPKLQQRIIKTSPHLYLPPNYKVSVYFDSNVIPNINVVQHCLLMMNCNDTLNGTFLFVAKHPSRKNIKSEAEEIIKLNLETNEHVQTLLNMQEKDQFQDDVGLSETALLIRKHHNIKEFSEDWTTCVNICIRDQISFNYLLWKHKIHSFQIPKAELYSKKKHCDDSLKHKRPINTLLPSDKFIAAPDVQLEIQEDNNIEKKIPTAGFEPALMP